MRVVRTAVLAALPLTLVLAPAATAAGAPPGASAADAGSSRPGAQVPLRAETSVAQTLVGEEPGGASLPTEAAARASFRVTYNGFSAPARAAFQRAVDAWSTQVSSSVPITVNATFRPLGAGTLGSAGPSLLHRDFRGAPARGTFYVDAMANKRAGRQLHPSADIVANFSSSYSNWHFGPGPAPRGRYDFQTVVMHEIGHGLGFLGAGQVSGGGGSVRLGGFPTAYDRFTENAAGKKLLSFPDGSAALARELTSGRVFFDSPAVRSANGGRPARLYAPGSFNGGSSYSHLDDATYRPGSPNSLMTPAIGDGETIRTSGPITRGIFATTGW